MRIRIDFSGTRKHKHYRTFTSDAIFRFQLFQRLCVWNGFQKCLCTAINRLKRFIQRMNIHLRTMFQFPHKIAKVTFQAGSTMRLKCNNQRSIFFLQCLQQCSQLPRMVCVIRQNLQVLRFQQNFLPSF